jgi:hypothetical protein
MAFALSAQIFGDLRAIVSDEYNKVADAARLAIDDASTSLQEELRRQVLVAGLGMGLEKAWQRKLFPPGNKRSLHPAALVYSKATKLHAAYDAGGIIRGKNGQYLAIPTDKVPNRAGSFGHPHPMSPVEVEAAFNQDLHFVPTRSGGLLVLRKVVKGKKKGTVRPATDRRLKQGRETESVVMFVLVRQARLKKALDIGGAAARAEQRLYNNLVSLIGN